MKITLKKVHELNASELRQLEALIHRYYSSASPKFVDDRLKKDYGYDIVMLKEGEIIQGVNFYHLTKCQTGRWSRDHYILHFGQVMKRSGYRGNIIWTLGTWYARRMIGRTYMLQNFTGLASFISPKAFEHYTRLFSCCHYEFSTKRDAAIQTFIVDYFNKRRGMNLAYGDGFCFDTTELRMEDITEDWNQVYRAKNEDVNQLFIKHGIIRMENDRIYKMPRHMTVCGIHRPLNFGGKLIPALGVRAPSFAPVPVMNV